MGSKLVMEFSELEDIIQKIIEKLRNNNADMYYLQNKSADGIINEILRGFGTKERKIISERGSSVEIIKPDVATQYINHISYLLEKKIKKK